MYEANQNIHYSLINAVIWQCFMFLDRPRESTKNYKN